jgi:hypothetical protein
MLGNEISFRSEQVCLNSIVTEDYVEDMEQSAGTLTAMSEVLYI